MKHILLLGFLFCVSVVFGQQTVNHHVDFASGKQNMWGPSFNAFNINRTITLFETSWNESGGTGNGGIVSLGGYDFGGALSGGTSGTIGSSFSLTGFTTGEVEVDYPIDVALDMPADLSYDQGDEVRINTSYNVDAANYNLDTYYPSVGEARLDFYFSLAFNLNVTLCAFGCTNFDLFPPLSTGLINLNIFKANAAGIEYIGPACPSSPMPGGYLGPCSDCGGSGCIPWKVKQDFLPADIPDNDYGISGQLTVPYVITDDQLLANKCLTAAGDSNYVNLSLEIFKLLGNFVPPPVGPVLQNLSGELPLPPIASNFGVVASYNIFSASFNAYLTNKQEFSFCPNIYGKFNFPTPVSYRIIDTLGAQYATGLSAEINFVVGETVYFDFPCFYEDLHIVPTYSIDPNFTNRTFDEITFDFSMSAIEFALVLPQIEIIPEICFPEICVNIPYPCPSWSNPGRWCTSRQCIPAFCTPALEFPGFSMGMGPLFSHTIPIGSPITYNWFQDTWDLEGFEDSTFNAFTMKARKFSTSSSHIDVLCKNDSTGSIDVTVNNGSAPFTYAWNTGQSTQDLIDIPAGSYAATVTDANGCVRNAGEVVTEPGNALEIEMTPINKACNGGIANGSIDITVQGGTPTYTYLWNNSATTEDISGLDVGMYSVTVTDANGCTLTDSVEIFEPSVLNDSIVTIDNVLCNGGNTGKISVLMNGGTFPYTYSWDNGASQANIQNLTAGTYELTVNDGNNCEFIETYVVAEPAAPITLSTTQSPINCFGAKDGSIDLTVNGGTAPYTYVWTDNQNQVINQSTQDVTNLGAGQFNVIVTDANGCSENTSETIGGPVSPISATAIITNVDCNGTPTGGIDVTVNGGNGGYTYLWSNGATTEDLTGVSAGTYSITISDANSCSISYSYTITEPGMALMSTFSVTDVDCFGNNTGSIDVVTIGGTAPYSFAWGSGQTTEDISNISAGNYDLTVTDANSCTTIINPVISEPAAPLALSETHTDILCFGGNNGAIDITTTGGTAGYTYSWSNAQNTLMTQESEDLNTLTANTYTVVVTDANQCVEQISVPLASPTAPIAISATSVDVDCNGNNTGSIDINVTGGTTNYTYAWSNSATTQDLSNLIAGTYTVTVTDNNSCVETYTETIAEPTTPLSGVVQVKPVRCFGETTGQVDLTVSGGTAPYTYLWSNGAVSEDIMTVGSGAYNVTITDANGCTAFTGGFVPQPANPLTVGVTVVDPSCYKYSDGSVSLNVTGGTTPYYFEWGNQVQYQLNNPSETLNNVSQGNYLLRVTDGSECVYEQTVTVNEPDTISITENITDALCFGNADGGVDVTITGGTTPYTYDWSNSSTNEDLVGVPAGEYSLTLIDDQGCRFQKGFEINEPAEIAINSIIEAVSCIDQTDGSITVQTAGGTQPYSWTWSNGQIEQNIKDLAPGMYSLTITDANFCQKLFNFIVPENNDECLEIPNTFTPNGDNYNDVWNISNLHLYPEASVQVYNRWGNLLYQSKGSYTPWNGQANGKDLPAEVYYYVIVLSNQDENKYTGTITIIR